MRVLDLPAHNESPMTIAREVDPMQQTKPDEFPITKVHYAYINHGNGLIELAEFANEAEYFTWYDEQERLGNTNAFTVDEHFDSSH